MAIQAVDVDTIVDDEEMNEFIGGQVHSTPAHIAPDQWEKRSKPARQYALDRVLEALRRLNPPIHYSDLVDPSELRLSILYGAAEHMYLLSVTEAGDVFDTHRKYWGDMFNASVESLAPTLGDGIRGATMGINVQRR